MEQAKSPAFIRGQTSLQPLSRYRHTWAATTPCFIILERGDKICLAKLSERISIGFARRAAGLKNPLQHWPLSRLPILGKCERGAFNPALSTLRRLGGRLRPPAQPDVQRRDAP